MHEPHFTGSKGSDYGSRGLPWQSVARRGGSVGSVGLAVLPAVGCLAGLGCLGYLSLLVLADPEFGMYQILAQIGSYDGQRGRAWFC